MTHLKQSSRRGFTLIELMLAMTFVALMLIAIATLIIRITKIYQKGLSMRAVNTSGRELIEDITRTVASSSNVDGDINPAANPSTGEVVIDDTLAARKKYFYQKTIEVDGKRLQVHGAFCMRDYVYVWNTPEIEKGTDDAHAPLAIGDSTLGYKIYKFARFKPHDTNYCEQLNDGNITSTNATNASGSSYKIFKLDKATSTTEVYDFLGGSKNPTRLTSNEGDESDLWIYDFKVSPAFQSPITGHAIYNFDFVIATKRGGINLTSQNDYCTGKNNPYGNEPDDEFTMSDFSYCAVNRFDFVARQGQEITDK
ncbi:type II secretion system protein [Candidatus Saccharibacteria bacterium]|nr:type II secretion system protein [Candidatus Saccharibacteria bacterium]